MMYMMWRIWRMLSRSVPADQTVALCLLYQHLDVVVTAYLS